MKRSFVILIVIIISSIAFYKITRPHGLGLTPDSTQYITAAEHLMEGKGFTGSDGNLINHWPPGYSLFLSIGSYVSGVDIRDIGIYLNIFILISLFLVFYLLTYEMNMHISISLIFPILLIISEPATVLLFYWSEGLFLLLFMISLYFFLRWIKTKKTSVLLLSGLFSGLFLLTRYAGIAFIGGYVFFLIFLNKGNFKIKTKQVITYIIPVIFFLASWVIYSSFQQQTDFSRGIHYHPIPFEKVYKGLEIIWIWFIYDKVHSLILIPAFSIFMIAAFLFKDKLKQAIASIRKRNGINISLIISQIIIFFVFLLLSISLFDAITPLYNRILAPLFPLLLLLIGIVINEFLFLKEFKLITFVIIILFSINIASGSYIVWNKHHTIGSGFTMIYNEESDLIKYITNNSIEKAYSNGYDIISYYKDKSVKKIPLKYDPFSLIKNPEYSIEIKEMKDNITANEFEIIYFDNVRRDFLMSKEEILTSFGSLKIIHFQNGFVVKNELN